MGKLEVTRVDSRGAFPYFLLNSADFQVSMTLDLFLSAVIGYFLGSIPNAYIVVRLRSRMDIRNTGSGNVGALNSYLVTRSRMVGAVVLLLDLFKGISTVLVARYLFGGVLDEAVAGVASVCGHNFPVWLNFKGGRGLATAAGVVLMLAWPLVPLWMLFWGIGYFLTRNVNVGNAIATVLLIFAMLAVPSRFLGQAASAGDALVGLRVLVVLMFSIILVKHIDPVRDFVRAKRTPGLSERTEKDWEKEKS
jgi:acyl phosphate:glycerol-3-phosphate acyltransferase